MHTLPRIEGRWPCRNRVSGLSYRRTPRKKGKVLEKIGPSAQQKHAMPNAMKQAQGWQRGRLVRQSQVFVVVVAAEYYFLL